MTAAPKDPKVPAVAEELRLGVAVGQRHSIEHVAAEAAVVEVALLVEPAEVEVQDRGDTRGADLVDEVAHALRRGADLLGRSALDGVEDLQSDPLGQAPQAQYPAVGRLADPPAPLIESPAPWVAGSHPQLVVHAAEAEAVGGDPITAGGRAVTEAGQGSGTGQERLQGRSPAPLLPPCRGVGDAQVPWPPCRTGATGAVAVAHRATRLRQSTAQRIRIAARGPPGGVDRT